MIRYIFITGGVVSSLGKGIASAALGALLQARGYKVRLRKLDPYLNVDPGTMSPRQHGEVYVTDDGAETDLDLGHYERFTGVSARQSDNITTGRIYKHIIEKERRGDYLGATIDLADGVDVSDRASGQLGRTVEAEPTEPEDKRTESGERDVVARHRIHLLAEILADTWPDDDGACQSCPATG